MLRSSQNWEKPPGNLDALNVEYQFPSSNSLGIVDMLPCHDVPTGLVPYGTQVRRGYAQVQDKCVHFFLDDYQFESLWSKPLKTLPPIQNIGFALSPDFSVFTDYPRIVQMWNVHRNRWLGRFWQSYGVEVIPTVAWGDEDTFDFCFLGVPKNNLVAVSTVGINSKVKKEAFNKGFLKMVEVLEPCGVIVYGETEPLKFEDYVDNVYRFPSFWQERRRIMKEKQNETSN